MPIIPKLNTQLSTDVPNVRVQPDSAISEAVADVGSHFVQVTSDIDERLARAEAINEATRVQLEDTIAAQDKMRELSLQYPSGYVTDQEGRKVHSISQEFYDWANARYKTNSTSMSSRMAQDMYNDAATKFFSTSFMSVKNEEFKMRKAADDADYAEILRTGMNSLSSAGPLVPHPTIPGVQVVSPVSALTMYDKMSERLVSSTGVIRSAEESKKLQSQSGEAIGGQFVDTVVTAATTSPKNGTTREAIIRQGLDVLDGRDPDQIERARRGLPTLGEIMGPEKHEDAKRKLLSLLNEAKKVDMTETNAMHTAALAAMMGNAGLDSSNPGRPDVNINEVAVRWGSAFEAGEIKPFEYAQKITELVATKQAQQFFSSDAFLNASETEKDRLKQASIEQARLTAKSILGADFYSKYNFVAEGQIKEIAARYDATDKQREALYKQDPFLWAETIGPIKALNQSIRASNFLANPAVAKPQEFRKIDQRMAEFKPTFMRYNRDNPNAVMQPLMKSEAATFAKAINSNTTNSDIIAQGLRNYAVNSRTYPAAIEQLVESKAINPGFRFTMYAGNRIDKMTAIVNAIKASEDIQSIVKDQPDAEEQIKTIRESVNKYSLPYFSQRLSVNPNNPAVLDEIRRMNDVITSHALLQSRVSKSKPEDAAKQAVEFMMGDRVPVQGAVDGSPVTLPLVEGVRLPSDDEKLFMSRRLETIKRDPNLLMSKYGAALPEMNFQGQQGKTFDSFWGDVNATAKFVPNHNGDYNIAYKNYEGIQVFLNTGKKDRFGHYIPVLIPKSDVNAPIKEGERTWWDKFLGRGKTEAK